MVEVSRPAKPGSSLAKSTSKTTAGSASVLEGTEEKRKPYCLVKTTEAVSWRRSTSASEKPSQASADVMRATSSHSTTAAYCTPRGGTTRAPGATSRSRASRRYSSADSPSRSVPNSSETTTSGAAPPAASTTSSRLTSVESFVITSTRSARPFAARFRFASSARLVDASIATTRRAPSRAASIASSPEPVPMSSTTDSPGTIARRRHSR
mmetsp:Transcript_2709/g.8515  ORF Transcript_2709/g.8515 Transcript_2709/m.8515 type:complete len:210 (+) Transcript_2709:778-1407(+)